MKKSRLILCLLCLSGLSSADLLGMPAHVELAHRAETQVANPLAAAINCPIYKGGCTLLHLVCFDQLEKIIKFVMENLKKPEVFDIQDDDGNTPLHLLCSRVDQAFIYPGETYSGTYSSTNDVLLSSEPSLIGIVSAINYVGDGGFFIRNKDGKTADELTKNLAVHNICAEAIAKKSFGLNSLQRQGPVITHSSITVLGSSNVRQHPYAPAAGNIDISTWKRVFSQKDPEQKNRTLLHFICAGDLLGAVKFLVKYGADVNLKTEKWHDGYGEHSSVSPLQCCNSSIPSCSDIRHKTALQPLYAGGNPQEIDKLLYESTKKKIAKFEQVIEYLLDHGAECSTRCSDFSDVYYRWFKKKQKNLEEGDQQSRAEEVPENLERNNLPMTEEVPVITVTSRNRLPRAEVKRRADAPRPDQQPRGTEPLRAERQRPADWRGSDHRESWGSLFKNQHRETGAPRPDQQPRGTEPLRAERQRPADWNEEF